MLDVAIDFVAKQLESYLGTHTGFDSVSVASSRLVDETGKYVVPIDSVGLTLVNVEEERTFKDQAPSHTFVAGQHLVTPPELRINLTLLVAANFKIYGEALKCLALVLTFFQSRPAFTIDRYPSLDPRIGRLALEMQTLSFEQLNQLWAFVGAKYLPSAVYRARVLVLQDFAPESVGPPITSISTTVGSR